MKWPKLALAATLILCSSCGFAVEVSTAADLATAIATSGTTVTLGADIDCTGWTTVDGFSGTLDGKGYKILNLDAPLFGTITGDIAISNLVVKDANVTATAETCGILLKSVTAANLAVENVTFTGSTLRILVNKGNMGFVVGLFSVTGTASFKDCHVDDTCSFALGVNQHGGIAGNGTATGTGNVAGGLVGFVDSLYNNNSVTATNCANYGTLSAPAEGGLTGEIFARFETNVADSPARQYGAVNSFFMTDAFCGDASGSAIITNGLVTAADAGYTPSNGKRTLNAVAAVNSYEPWVLGRIGDGDAAPLPRRNLRAS